MDYHNAKSMVYFSCMDGSLRSLELKKNNKANILNPPSNTYVSYCSCIET